LKKVEDKMSQREEQCGEQADNLSMPMAMLMQLQKEFEMLKKVMKKS